ncbi:4Fe-4S dicluster domain-containing protein [Candidatus Aerophobetes bacterium]|nr:4Fe-4S dicluster domain-containing protein [Candidatus Aerophobetes bacterium]
MRINLSINKTQSRFLDKVESLSGENIYACYQCGKCSAGCPGISKMDLFPSEIIRLIQFGEEEEVLESKTPWICASCFTCTIRCPKGVDLSKVMEAVRQIILRKNIDHVSPLSISKKMLSQLPQIALVSSFRKFTS